MKYTALPWIGLVLAATAAHAAGVPATGPPRDLLLPAATGSSAPDTKTTLRRRPVNVDFQALQGLALGAQATIRLNLFGDAAFTGIIDRVERNGPTMFSYFGHLQEDDLGDFQLVQNKDVMVGTVRAPRTGRLFSITFSPEQVHYVRQLIESNYGVCGNKSEAGAPVLTTARLGGPSPGPAPPAGDASCGDDGPLAVLVMYTNVTRAASGSTASMEAEVQQAVNTSNTTYANSQIGMRMRLVHTEEIAYDEVGTFQNHLDRLESTNDGIMDNVHNIRNQYGADTVVLIVEDDDSDQAQSLCGLASQMTSLSDGFNTSAFAIVNRGCASGNFSFPHEVGHNLGCDHDRANKGSAQIATYAFGWLFDGNPSKSHWRTVMAYNGTPASTRVGFFSNPNVSFDGTPTGIQPGQANESDNALVIGNSTLTATNWRRDNMWVQFGYGGNQTGCPGTPWATFGGGVNAVPWTGTVIVEAGTTNEHFTITKPMTLTSSGGPAVIGKL